VSTLLVLSPGDLKRRRLEALWPVRFVSTKSQTNKLAKHSAPGLKTRRIPANSGEPSVRIGIEIRHIVEEQTGGITPLLHGSFEALSRSAPDHQFYFFGTIFNRRLPNKGSNIHSYSLPLGSYWDSLEALLVSEQIDVLFRSYPVDDSLKFPLERQVCLVRGLQQEGYTQFMRFGAVVTLSQRVGNIIRENYPNKFDDVFVLPSISESTIRNGASHAKIKPLIPYFLCPAELGQHKNYALLLNAFASFRKMASAYEKFSLVLSGDPEGWSDFGAKHDITNVSHLGFVPAQDLLLLYQNATALVFPSRFEDFKIPLPEAFGSGAGLREVAEDSAVLLEPSNHERLARAMALVASAEVLRQSPIAKRKDRLHHHTCEKSASVLRRAFERVHERNIRVHVKEAPLVSIVTPSLNQGRFIRRTIDSVLGQTYPHLEYRVIDGGSTDNTLEVLRSYGSGLSWTSEPDQGQANAINKGFTKSKGEILAYLNSDDTLNPKAVETVVSLFRKNPHLSMLYGDAKYIDGNDRVIRAYPTADYSFEQLMQYCCICQPAAFWTAQIARDIGTFNESLHFHMDYDYWLRMGKADALIIHVPFYLANSRIYPETKTMLLGPAAYREIFDVCLSHGGYVSERWIRGFLRCKPDERRWLLRLVSHRWGQQKLFEYYTHRFGKSRLSVTAALSKMLGRELRGTHHRGKVSKKEQKTSRLRPCELQQLPSPVTGFLPEGYLLAKSRFISERIKSRRPLRLTGSPVVDTHVEVRSGGELILSKSLEADLEATLEFVAIENEVTITFDAFRRTKDGRQIAFRLTDTNLFSEQELNPFM
jgi:glycosyltransferase involved in cell wall biosynthesis